MPSESAATSSARRTCVRSGLAMTDGLDVVAVRVEHERPVIGRVVDLADARRAFVAPAGRQGGRVEGVQGRPVLDPEGHMCAAVRPPAPLADPEEREVASEPAEIWNRL